MGKSRSLSALPFDILNEIAAPDQNVEWSPVVSSNLSYVGYNPATAVLTVEFIGGSMYEYYSVPESVYLGLTSAGSPGRYLHYNVKGVYAYARV